MLFRFCAYDIILALLGVFRVTLSQSFPDDDVLANVDQLIGTFNGGNVFAGATLPYGMAKAVADVSGQNTAGFSTDGSNVTGFSHMHDSGTGGNPSLGNFPLFPQLCPGDEVNNCKFSKLSRAVNYVNESIKASPGYFSLGLVNGIRAEMTVTEHAALYHFDFPKSEGKNSPISPLILLDLTDIGDTRQNASISVEENGRVKGNGTFLPSFGSGSYISYFCVDFAGAAVRDTGIFVNDRAGNEPKQLFVTRGINSFFIQAGAFVRFRPSSDSRVKARVGVSLISTDRACQNAEQEIKGPDWDFDLLKRNAENNWRKKLNGIAIKSGGVTQDFERIFWSAIYRTMISPQDYTGENPLWQSDEPYFDSFYW